MIGELVAFAGVAALLIVTPGQDTALLIRNTLLRGRAGGVATALGVASGQAVWTAAASAGIAAVLAASEPAFLALKVAGTAYLAFIGLQALRDALRPGRGHAGAAGAMNRPAAGRLRAYRQGLLSNLGNPKMAVFFVSLLPQLTGRHPSLATLLGFGLLFCAMTLAWLTGYAFVIARAGDLLRRGRVRRLLDGLTGAALIAFGVRLATAER
ncbi:MAG TPA: LysE family translocator [Candidatus Dormibacteraeota bacterium]|nr:LysE family translocator [Candidatus Dormibacteraeota bacterium]